MSEFRLSSNYGYGARKRRHKKSSPSGRQLKLLRAEAEVRVGERVIDARVLLSDIFPRAIFFFSPEPLRPDVAIAVTIAAPTQFYAVGRVVSCHVYRMNLRVIEAALYPYRVSVAFEFETEAEMRDVRDYVGELRSRFVFK